jgi:hypothetical protein
MDGRNLLRAASGKPRCRLIGEDGNVFNVIGLVKRALERAGQSDEAREFVRRAKASRSYTEVLGLAMEYTEVE